MTDRTNQRRLYHTTVMDSIPQPEGVLHIASEPGAGATSLALQLIRHSLEESGRIVWIGREMPNPNRLSDIIGILPPTALSRFHAGAFGEHISRGIEQSLDLIEGLESITYVVIDDWAGVSGKVSSELIQMMNNLILLKLIHCHCNLAQLVKNIVFFYNTDLRNCLMKFVEAL